MIWTVCSRVSLRKICLRHGFELQLCLLCQRVGTPYWRPWHTRENRKTSCLKTVPAGQLDSARNLGYKKRSISQAKSFISEEVGYCNDSYPRSCESSITCPCDMTILCCLQVNPPLKQCRVLLFGGADHQSFADCSVHLSNGTFLWWNFYLGWKTCRHLALSHSWQEQLPWNINLIWNGYP